MAARPAGEPMARFASAFAVALSLALFTHAGHAGPYTEPGHAIAAMIDWAAEVEEFDRGPMNIANPGLGDASHGQPEAALGPAPGNDVLNVVSLGDGGSLTLFFPNGISDGAGDDFAVFENAFFAPDGLFAELAYVEVSSNGSDFARFDADSLTAAPVLAFGSIDPTNIRNLAGKQPIDQGTGFDLAELADHPLVTGAQLDLQDVAYVRIVDSVGDGSRLDADGDPIYDPWATPFPQSGFDVQAVGVIHVPEPGALAQLVAGASTLALLQRRKQRVG
jgi:hypothetical protein